MKYQTIDILQRKNVYMSLWKNVAKQWQLQINGHLIYGILKLWTYGHISEGGPFW